MGRTWNSARSSNFFDYGSGCQGKEWSSLKEYSIPVWVMEPVRGGKLAKLDDEYEARLKALRPERMLLPGPSDSFSPYLR